MRPLVLDKCAHPERLYKQQHDRKGDTDDRSPNGVHQLLAALRERVIEALRRDVHVRQRAFPTINSPLAHETHPPLDLSLSLCPIRDIGARTERLE